MTVHDHAQRRGPTIALVSADGRVAAAVSTLAGALRSLVVDGVAVVEPTADAAVPPGAAGTLLAPWPNRVDGALWVHEGATQRLEVTEPGLGHALHGLLLARELEVVAATDSGVELRARLGGERGYPFAIEVTVRYALRDDGVDVTITARNRGSGRAPFAAGSHPYLRVGDVPVDELSVQVDADTELLLDDRYVPIDRRPVAGTASDLRSGAPVPEAPRHAAFAMTGSARPLRHALEAPDGTRVELHADPAFRFTWIYLAEALDTDQGPRRALAIEPMSAPANALRTGEGLAWIEPGSQWSAGFSIRLVQASRAR
ncbi:aldose 1-epimerase [Agromyces hippuratus]|uniref:Aldose 1-epimerase n=2 Tax=Agromyces hippuratus TaxID=286438 RepID=A0A852WXZ5_9MICO|nr:aldose epimerase [Agromyces hippuratus]NYG22438.1 aldose 1-epimerase [Agromyces hippuratus]